MPKRQVATIEGSLLVWARTTANFTREEAADKIGIPAEELAQLESGKCELSVPRLREIANLYKRPLAAFFLAAPPTTFRVPHDFRKRPGSAARRFSPEFSFEFRRAVYRRQVALELADETPSVLDERVIGKASLTSDVDALAEHVREILGVSLEMQNEWPDRYAALNGWKNSLEELGILVFHFSGVDVEDVRGFSISQSPFPIIGVNGSDSPQARVFTLLHELGHLMLNDAGSCDLHESGTPHGHDEKVEVFCNLLAGAVLVPRKALIGDETVRAHGAQTHWEESELVILANRFGVSREVILRRLLIIGRTTQTFYQSKRLEYGSVTMPETKGGPIPVPRRVLRTIGQPFARIVLNAYHREAISSSELAEYLGVRLKHLPAIEKLLAGTNVLTGGDQ